MCTRFIRPLLERIEKGELDPTTVITHRMPLADVSKGYALILNKEDSYERWC